MDRIDYEKFPLVLRNALVNGEVIFNIHTQFIYSSFIAYRAITREKGITSTKIVADDFKSYKELGKTPRGISGIGMYSCSLFLNINTLETAMKLPRHNKKIIVGYVLHDMGPHYRREDRGHVDWWLYKDSSPENHFKIVKGDD